MTGQCLRLQGDDLEIVIAERLRGRVQAIDEERARRRLALAPHTEQVVRGGLKRFGDAYQSCQIRLPNAAYIMGVATLAEPAAARGLGIRDAKLGGSFPKRIGEQLHRNSLFRQTPSLQERYVLSYMNET